MRKIQVTAGGKWYLALTVALGVVAIYSGNNTMYLIESLLLSGLILSGYLSERIVSGITVEVERKPISAFEPSRDLITVRNNRKHPLFSIEINEYRKGKYHSLAFFPMLGPRAISTSISRQQFLERGSHEWDGLGISTSYPFGFARKTLLISAPGRRIIWPRKLATAESRRESNGSAFSIVSGVEMADGEIRGFQNDDDYRCIVWSLSAKGIDPVVRLRRSETQGQRVQLDLRNHDNQEAEKKIEVAAQPFLSGSPHVSNHSSDSFSLTLFDEVGKRTIRGRKNVLNLLAILKKEPK